MTLLDQTWPARIAVEELPLTVAPRALLDGLDAFRDPVFLDSSADHGRFGRYSMLTCEPLDVLTLTELGLHDAAGGRRASTHADLWPALRDAFACVAVESAAETADDPPAQMPGWFGYVGYEVGRWVEKLPGRAPRDTALPDLRLGFYDAVLVHDRTRGTWQLVRLVFDGDAPAGAGRAADCLRRLAEQVGTDAVEVPAASPITVEDADPRVRPMARAEPNFTPEEYRAAVGRCVEYIAAGDIFQANLSQRLTVADAPPARAAYHALRRRNPAWFAAYLRLDSGDEPIWLLSSSPELFLRVRSRHVVTRPIKGTRPRSGDADADVRASEELLASAKDNAELAMIIDLLRNDLGRVCRYGSVRVTQARVLETHPTVYHLVGTVEGDLYEGVGPAELLRAAFPGGSITGAPKIRAMEIIDELERGARGVYTGSIGTVGVDGSCEWNIAIRTVVCERGRAHVQVGGGIVADSTPEGEYEETLDKARAMLEALAEARLDGCEPASTSRGGHTRD